MQVLILRLPNPFPQGRKMRVVEKMFQKSSADLVCKNSYRREQIYQKSFCVLYSILDADIIKKLRLGPRVWWFWFSKFFFSKFLKDNLKNVLKFILIFFFKISNNLQIISIISLNYRKPPKPMKKKEEESEEEEGQRQCPDSSILSHLYYCTPKP